MNRAAVEDLLEQFRVAFQNGDEEGWSRLYDRTVVLMRPHETKIMNGPEEMRQVGRTVYEAYQKLDLARVVTTIRDIRGFDPGIVLLDVTIDYYNSKDEQLLMSDVTYGLRRRAGGYRIALHIPHNEAVRRPIFLETDDPDLLIGGQI
ncbi:nuclear transport factor 2 family protein [Pontivivens insulae]|uniref:Uncharacterized protein n=1 Tax=Pontivivens insulae TaxID=1639689 RepID=A0A2R8AA60_9RHOB|nr:nuclear transport factor 2 family protein [Pontivivens insulae]RED13025.1 SnoaL-like protein [Pontivivens insulae]SPF29117.1 hypothetical protein POI8812_01423 [Pontivivens insulae]